MLHNASLMRPWLSLLFTGLAGAAMARAETLYVAPDGADIWSGKLQQANASRTDGPFASLAGARDAIRRRKASNGLTAPIHVVICEGPYSLAAPFVLEPQDSGTAPCPITYAAAAGRRPVISGGRPITGWRKQGPRWIVELPEVREGKWYFSALWVNGERRTMARTPNEGCLYTAGNAPPKADPGGGKPVSQKAIAFKFRPGDIRPWSNLDDAEVVIYQSWETSTHRIASVDEARRIVTFRNAAPWPFDMWGGAVRYYIQNVPEALDAPGEWYLDRKAGILSYIPFVGEDPRQATVIAPVAQQLVRFQGKPAEGQFVEHVKLAGLRLLYTDWTCPPEGYASAQAACDMGAAIEALGARNCSIEDCELAHLGAYGVWLRSGSQDCRIAGNDMHDLGAGGVRLGEREDPLPEPEAAQRNTVDNNFIHDGGKIDPGAVGVWIGQTSYNTVSHNEICDLDYTGISVGWSWGYAPTSAHHNTVEFNHIHDLGRGVLGDMGGIYCLGVSPGTVIRNNLVHDIYDYRHGSMAIYTDEGSSNITIENNIGYRTAYANFHHHYGRENIVRNNIWALGWDFQLSRGRQEEHLSFTFERNIVYFDSGKLMNDGWTNDSFVMDNNLYWDTSHPAGDFLFGKATFAQWQARGHDRHSLIADPKFVNPAKFDFRLKTDSPALKIGFVPIDTGQIGLYGDPGWVAAPKRIQRKPFVPAPTPPPVPIAEDFEDLFVDTQPDGVHISVEASGGAIAVTDETAAGGTHSLKFTDAPGQKYNFNPHMYYSPGFTEGTLVGSFDVRIEAGAIGHFEWRDSAGGDDFKVGPSLRIEGDGRMLSRGKEIGRTPLGQWVHIEITCRLGARANGKWSLRYGPAGSKKMIPLSNLECDAKFKKLDWLGFVSDAASAVVFYTDNIKLEPAAGQ